MTMMTLKTRDHHRAEARIVKLEEALLVLGKYRYIRHWEGDRGSAPAWDTLNKAEQLDQAGRFAGVNLAEGAA